jgi:TRAP-type mannitol/chloroaromatic compound transport system permease large subunit
MVLGLMLLGVAAPSEAAATGAVATLLVTLFYGRLNCSMLKASFVGTVEISVIVLMIINLEMGMTNPPFGVMLFVMKGVAPPSITIKDICGFALYLMRCGRNGHDYHLASVGPLAAKFDSLIL